MIKRYQPSDYEMIMTWLDKRKMPRLDKGILSSVGFVVPDVCAVWIYGTDSDLCYLENLISNPDVKEKQRGLDMVIDTALRAAKILGYKFVLSVSGHPSVIGKALKKGASVQTKQTLLTYKIL